MRRNESAGGGSVGGDLCHSDLCEADGLRGCPTVARIAALEAENRELRVWLMQIVGHAQDHGSGECGSCQAALLAALKGGGGK